MSIHLKKSTKANPELLKKKKTEKEKISALTAYDYTTASILNQTKIDFILVGDSAANVMAGYESTLPITLDEMIYHTKSVVKGAKDIMVVADLPFGSYQGGAKKALDSAIRMMKETGVQALKLEGGDSIKKGIKKIIQAGIPVMGHLGLMPQSIHHFGNYGVRAREEKEAQSLLKEAQLLEEIGCFALVLEKIPAILAKKITSSLSIPTIGIGAGDQVDGQILVLHDLLGMNKDFHPKFVRKYLNLYDQIHQAVNHYDEDVKSGNFPSLQEQY